MAMCSLYDASTGIVSNQKFPYQLQKNPGITPAGDNSMFTSALPKNPGIVSSPKLDEFVKTLSEKNEKPIVKEKNQKPNAPISKKLGVSLASVLYSGLGQAVNGQWGKALGFSIGESVATIAGFCLGGPLGAMLGAFAVKGLSIYDAVKNV